MRYTDPTGHIYLDNECGYQGQDCGDSIFNSGDSDEENSGTVGNVGGNGNNYCDTHPGACGTSPTILEPVPTNEPTNQNYCLTHPYACGSGAQTQSFLTQEESPVCPVCILQGAAIIGAMMPIELALGAGMVMAAPLPGGLVADLLLLPLEIAALNVTLIGIEYIAQGQNRTREELQIDPLPIIPTSNHMFNPDIWK